MLAFIHRRALMDPEACLLRLTIAIDTGNFAEAVAALNDYYQWRVKGGFEPKVREVRGDVFADNMANKLADKL
jgi:hypothetical protein